MSVEPVKPYLAHANWIVAGLLVLIGLIGLFAIEWTTYEAFDQTVFDLPSAVSALLRTVIDALA